METKSIRLYIFLGSRSFPGLRERISNQIEYSLEWFLNRQNEGIKIENFVTRKICLKLDLLILLLSAVEMVQVLYVILIV